MHNNGSLAALVAQDEGMAEAALKNSWKTDLDAASAAGTLVHDRLEALIKGAPPPVMTPAAEQVFTRLQGLIRDYNVVFLHSECAVYGLTPGLEWAGTLDAIVEMDVPGRGRRCLVADLKTGKGVYDEACFQVGGAYSHADKLVTGDDGTIIDMPKVDGAVVFHVRQDFARVIPVAADDTAYAAFMAARTIWRIQHDKEWTAVFAPLPASSKGDER